ncbi:unnamed protein product, partial [Prorocentrum cordatum]
RRGAARRAPTAAARAAMALAAAVAGALLRAALLLRGASAWSWGSGWIAGPSTKTHATDELDGSTFEPFLKENPVAAILFYAPWCFYSQQMMPAWDLAHQKMQLHDPPVPLAPLRGCA